MRSPFRVMDSSESKVVELIWERSVVTKLVQSGAATWIEGRRAVRLCDRDDAPHTLRIVVSQGGPSVVQRVRL